MLSQYKFRGCFKCEPNLESNLIHFTFATRDERALYSDSSDDLATTFCLLDSHETSLSLRNTQYVPTLLRSTWHVAQLAFKYPTRSKWFHEFQTNIHITLKIPKSSFDSLYMFIRETPKKLEKFAHTKTSSNLIMQQYCR